MSDQYKWSADPSKEAAAQATDRLATSLEEAGFDVGRDFPDLAAIMTLGYGPPVRVGRISIDTAARLCDLLARVQPAGDDTAG
ncbi:MULTISPECIES: hypothetical protein [Catenuloplanes]|uniref:Uncharacterized protein n=1 Tax=Catenuloplanes niger TaxID=587534 RepID=A0AAE3ZRC9_9ACTN|nr:hypothetical protein [Catenuloplanes niger]MDR7322440.1 hypothetical protein [Catenuloplanes niger]